MQRAWWNRPLRQYGGILHNQPSTQPLLPVFTRVFSSFVWYIPLYIVYMAKAMRQDKFRPHIYDLGNHSVGYNETIGIYRTTQMTASRAKFDFDPTTWLGVFNFVVLFFLFMVPCCRLIDHVSFGMCYRPTVHNCATSCHNVSYYWNSSQAVLILHCESKKTVPLLFLL